MALFLLCGLVVTGAYARVGGDYSVDHTGQHEYPEEQPC